MAGERLAVEEPLLSISEAARLMGVCENTLRDWDEQHKFAPALRTEGGHRRYRLMDVRAYLDKNPPPVQEPRAEVPAPEEPEVELETKWRALLEDSRILYAEYPRLAMLLENVSEWSRHSTSGVLNEEQRLWLTAHAWARCRLKRMVSIQILRKPCQLVFYCETEKTRFKEDAVACQTAKYDFSLFTEAKFDDMRDAYATAIAREIDQIIFWKLFEVIPCDLEIVMDMTAMDQQARLNETYDFIAGPRPLLEKVRSRIGFHGVGIEEQPGVSLDPKTFKVAAIAGQYPKDHLRLPIFLPYLIALDFPMRASGLAGMGIRCAWYPPDKKDASA